MVIRILSVALATALLSACAVGPDYRAAAPAPVQLHNAQAPGTVADSPVAQWWRQFDDPVLERLVADALLANPDLRIAMTRVRAARAVFGERRLEPWPHVSAGAAGERTRPPDAAGGGIDEVYSLGFDAAWELDLFGRLRRGAQAARADLQAEQAGLEDVQVSVAAEVARNYFLLRGTQKRIEVAERTLSNLGQTQRLTETREELGAGSALDVHSSRARLKAIEAGIPLLRSTEAAARYRLAVLLGLRPGALDVHLAPRPAPAYARPLPLGDTRELLRQRPDVRAAERRLAAATAQVGVATADLFPRIGIRGFAGFLSGDFSGLVAGRNEAWSVAPSISWAAFDMGSVRARLRAVEAGADGAAVQYEKTVLLALEDAENALQGYARQQERLRIVVEQAASAREAERLAAAGYREGASDFLVLLDAQRSQLAADDALAEAEAAVNIAAVAVYKALGGAGTDTRQGIAAAELPPRG
ncbi:RND transporter [Pseudoxanthomonas broegbernensis]|uniref:RND transporter n=1 Tax=Pseudoxanthomonas broegbernensis TaxID=83619 RepID=A0A7V8GKC0_9GAMM|nr:efflux transporter outer membrane subunit [Pseudoxanthomonas broegbernensis]KAF1684974.1 RND transporter [Pseudoxanthomonas broegbernensis]MBB6064839.1 NodT family efflux transporter outer membrane factor (OMF) lipoprotein [Pseudoxanthomonas broegbernensis]